MHDGDRIELDVAGGTLDLLVEETEVQRRRESWRAPPPAERARRGVLAKYARLVGSAAQGAVTH